MLRLQHISLVQFKNYSNTAFDFTERIIGICGNNGVGKTNLLDAIHYLCFTKSYFSRQDTINARHGSQGFRIEGLIEYNDKPEKAVCILRETGRKEFSVNDQPYDKFSKHYGRYPCVVIAPDDAQLITGRSDERRRFLDELLSQIDPVYLQQLIIYTKVLQQRNSLLRSFADINQPDMSLLDVLDEQLIKPADYIFNKRKEFLVSFLPMVKHLYQGIASRTDDSRTVDSRTVDSRTVSIQSVVSQAVDSQTPKVQEDINLFYESELLQANMSEWLSLNRNRDCGAQRTCSGIHRDDLEMELGGQEFKAIASQGQRKSLLFALKLAEMEVLAKEKGFAPLLLLDDVFEKLDEERIGNLLHKVCVENEGQVFITDTNEERLRAHLDISDTKYQMINL